MAKTGRNEKWQLSGPLKESIAFHHYPLEANPEHRRLVFAITAANYFCIVNEIGFAGDRHGDEIPQEVWSYLNISEKDLYGAEKEIENEIEKASVFLKALERGG